MRKLMVFLSLWFLCASPAQTGQIVRYWYYADNANTDPIPALVKLFAQLHPGITVRAERVPFEKYHDKIHTAVIGGNTPDAALLTLAAMPPLLELDALEPLDARIASWQGKEDIIETLWRKLSAEDTKTYLLPLRFDMAYLYIRRDMLEKDDIPFPTTLDEFLFAAQKLTVDADNDGIPDIHGFGFSATNGGHTGWGMVVMPNARTLAPWELGDPWVDEANRIVIDMYRTHRIIPLSALGDSTDDSVQAFRNGEIGMLVHRYSMADTIESGLNEQQFTVIPVPHCGKNGEAWTSFHDEENAVFASSEAKDAAWEWIAFLATGENNQRMAEAAGWLPVTRTGLNALPARRAAFAQATLASLPFAFTLPLLPQTEEFVHSVWPRLMQQAFRGEIDSHTMLQTIDQLFNE